MGIIVGCIGIFFTVAIVINAVYNLYFDQTDKGWGDE